MLKGVKFHRLTKDTVEGQLVIKHANHICDVNYVANHLS